MSLHFENLGLLWLLLALVPLLWIMHRRAKRFGENTIARAAVISAAFFAAIIGLTQPQLGKTASSARARVGQVFIAFDISRSMLVEDMTGSRLDFAIAFAQRLVEQIPRTKVALYPFAAEGYLQVPLTTDLSTISEMIGNLNPTQTTHQGTDLTEVLTSLYNEINRQQQKHSENGIEWASTHIVLISDGETHVPLRTDSLNGFKSKQWPIYTVGVGTLLGGRVPMQVRYGNAPASLDFGVEKTTVSQFHPEVLKAIAEKSGGAYFAPRFEEVSKLADRLDRAIAFGTLSTTFKVERELYPWFFAIALLLFLLNFQFGRWQYAIRAVALALLFASSPLHAGDDTKAVDTYNAGLKVLKSDPKAAAELFEESAAHAENAEIKKKALYSLGNAYLKAGKTKKALGAYQSAYELPLADIKDTQEANRRISDNMMLAARIQKQQQQQQKQSDEEKSGEGEGQGDPQGPQKDFESQNYSEEEKKRIFDIIASEEQQTLARIQQNREGRKGSNYMGKPW